MRNARLLIAENVKRLRLSLNLTQEQVAARAEMPHRTYQNLEYGRSMPHSRNIEKLAKALGVSEAELFKDQRVPQPPPALSQVSISKMTPEELNAFTRAILENNKKLEAENAGIQYKQHQNVDSVDKSHIEALEKQVRELKEQNETMSKRLAIIDETMAAIEDLEKIAPHLRKYVIAASKNERARNLFTAILGEEALGERTGEMQADELAVLDLMIESGAFDEHDRLVEEEKKKRAETKQKEKAQVEEAKQQALAARRKLASGAS